MSAVEIETKIKDILGWNYANGEETTSSEWNVIEELATKAINLGSSYGSFAYAQAVNRKHTLGDASDSDLVIALKRASTLGYAWAMYRLANLETPLLSNIERHAYFLLADMYDVTLDDCPIEEDEMEKAKNLYKEMKAKLPEFYDIYFVE